jgi:large subunit ribosomal protein L28
MLRSLFGSVSHGAIKVPLRALINPFSKPFVGMTREQLLDSDFVKSKILRIIPKHTRQSQKGLYHGAI